MEYFGVEIYLFIVCALLFKEDAKIKVYECKFVD